MEKSNMFQTTNQQTTKVHNGYPLVMTNSLPLKMAMEIVFPVNMITFRGDVNVYQRVGEFLL